MANLGRGLSLERPDSELQITGSPEEYIQNQILIELDSGTEERYLHFAYENFQTAHSVIEQFHGNLNYRFAYHADISTLSVLIRPSFIHECFRLWLSAMRFDMLVTGFITCLETFEVLQFGPVLYKEFQPPYQYCKKQPDENLVPRTQTMPSIVLESGWRETVADLHRNRNLWLLGGAPDVRLVIIVKFTEIPNNRVKGYIELFDRDLNGDVRSIQKETIFPEPDNANQQRIRITKGQYLGSLLPSRYDANDYISISLGSLRYAARYAIIREGFRPA